MICMETIFKKVFEDSACKEDLFNTLFSNKLLRHINLPDFQLSQPSYKIFSLGLSSHYEKRKVFIITSKNINFPLLQKQAITMSNLKR